MIWQDDVVILRGCLALYQPGRPTQERTSPWEGPLAAVHLVWSPIVDYTISLQTVPREPYGLTIHFC